MNFPLHCLPGDWTAKGAVLEHAATALRPGGRVFGRLTVRGCVALFEAVTGL